MFRKLLCPSSGVIYCAFGIGKFHAGFDDRFQAESGWSCILTLLGSGHQKPARNLPVPNMQLKTPDDGQRKCPKHIEFYNRINLDN